MKIEVQDYTISVGSHLTSLPTICEALEVSKILVLVDENTQRDCLHLLRDWSGLSLEHVITIKSGEQQKNLETCHLIWRKLFAMRADRKTLVLNLGGGVIGDMGGFCASTFMRGIPFIQIPTTLLSQVDASIGGKLGVDFDGLKNAVGLFNNPQAVFIEPDFLKTLPSNEIRSGYAEIIKHGLIHDINLWNVIIDLTDLNDVDWSDLILPSLEVKRQVILDDPFEKGKRKILNFGHTIGHAVESVMLDSKNPLLHGEAIAIGMIAEAYLSCQVGDLAKDQLEKVSAYILSIFGKVSLDMELFGLMMDKMRLDKKNVNDEINFTLLRHIGEAVINGFASDKMIKESLEYYLEL